jgi:isopentenyl-diphosphate Delta-isomerase
MAAPEEALILVDARNRARGVGDKLAIHRQGLLHRAFSIFIVDDQGRLLLQKRQADKYHSGGLWANACCGHPRAGETTSAAAARRLQEELGLRTKLTLGFKSRYCAQVGPDMHENEFVYVYFGRMQGEPRPDPAEIEDIAFSSLEAVAELCGRSSGGTTVWLRHYLTSHKAQLRRAIEQILP